MSRMFRTLAFDTSVPGLSVAACVGERVALREDRESPAGTHSIYALISDVLAEVGTRLEELDCVAFGCGPGGFTGLRVGAAAAQALAFGAGVPVCRVSSLEILAQGAVRVHDARRIAPALDARMRQAYVGRYAVDEGGIVRPEVDDALTDPGDWTLPPDHGYFAVGPGFAAYPVMAENNRAGIGLADVAMLPCAADLVILARERVAAGRVVAVDDALPNYIRDRVVD